MSFSNATYRIVGGVVSFVCFAYLLYKVWAEWDDMVLAFGIYGGMTGTLATVFALMFVNIGLEGVRWHTLCRHMAGEGKRAHLYSSILAWAYGNATPGGIGEHVARASMSQSKDVALGLSIVASVLQTLVIYVLGTLAMFFLHVRGANVPEVPVIIINVGVGVGIVALFFFSRILQSHLSRIYAGIRAAGWGAIVMAALVNAVRVSVFSLQLALLLGMGRWPSPTLMATVFVYYYILTFCPRLSSLDVGVKCGLGLAVFGGMVSDSAITASLIILTLVNNYLPSLSAIIFMRIRNTTSGH